MHKLIVKADISFAGGIDYKCSCGLPPSTTLNLTKGNNVKLNCPEGGTIAGPFESTEDMVTALQAIASI